ncbi:hypothetical protein HYV86_00135 [Candidatus Woesearchaeota archaeon]|nr:hypothetical protein [Candidatus Woesearchaeota archaeon]
MSLDETSKRRVVQLVLGNGPYGEVHYELERDMLDWIRGDVRPRVERDVCRSKEYLEETLRTNITPWENDPTIKGYCAGVGARNSPRVVFYHVHNLVDRIEIGGAFWGIFPGLGTRLGTLDRVVRRSNESAAYVDFVTNTFHSLRATQPNLEGYGLIHRE